MKKVMLLTALLAATASAVPSVPAGLKNRKVQFSYSPSWKFTPLLMHFGKEKSGAPNTYMLNGEDRSCEVTYKPDSTARVKAQMVVKGAQDTATINMTFVTDVCGIAHMRWNRADYYHLTFRLAETATGADYLCRMGDPVGDVVPVSLAGKVLEIDFSGAIDATVVGNEPHSQWSACQSTPLVIQFPTSGHAFTITRNSEPPAGLEEEWSTVAVNYELLSCGAMVELSGCMLRAEISLDFEDSESGLAHVSWDMDDSVWLARGATFRIRPAKSANGTVQWPSMDNGTPTTELSVLIGELQQRRYDKAVDRLYQQRLLTLLPRIAAGAPVDSVLENANGTTALHNACGLSHVAIVQWLVDHGADTQARTAKGASVDDCVGGPNARAIRTILQKARK